MKAQYKIEHLFIKEGAPFELDEEDTVLLIDPDPATTKIHVYMMRRYFPPT